MAKKKKVHIKPFGKGDKEWNKKAKAYGWD